MACNNRSIITCFNGICYKNIKKSVAYPLLTHYNIKYTGITFIKEEKKQFRQVCAFTQLAARNKIQIKIGNGNEKKRKKNTHVIVYFDAQYRIDACNSSPGEKK